ncbi:MAG: hypothetical protein KGI54_14395, partial [Pseudomonadota bacterium]|nr:hypothetical protein [Pseudomonadota bacterium]
MATIITRNGKGSPLTNTELDSNFTNINDDLATKVSSSGLGAGVSSFLTTPTSSNLAAAVSDETGSGSLVFSTSP